jgi:hypothetical protein
MSGEDAPRPYLENLIVPEIKTNKQTQVMRRHPSGFMESYSCARRSAIQPNQGVGRSTSMLLIIKKNGRR